MLPDGSRRDAEAPADEETLALSKQDIEAHEQRRRTCYLDDAGRRLIGVGFDLDGREASAAIEAIGANVADVIEGRASLNDAQIDALFDGQVRQALALARAGVSGFDELPIDARRRHVDLAFALGDAEFTHFTRLVDAIETSTWERDARSVADPETDRRELLADDEDS